MKKLKPIHGVAADFILLDCGVPVPGPTEGLLEVTNPLRVELTPVYDEGTAILVKDARGRIVVDEPACPYLTHYEVSVEMEGITPTHTAWLSGDRVVDASSGAVFGQRTSCPPYFGVRVWQDIAGGRKLCTPGTVEYIVHHLAMVTDFKVTGSYAMHDADSTRVTMSAKAYPNGGAYQEGYVDALGAGLGSWAAAWFDEEIHGFQIETTPLPAGNATGALDVFENAAGTP